MVIEQSRNDSIKINGGEHVTFSNVVIRNSGRWGIIIGRGFSHTVKDSTISQTANGAISINQAGDRLALIPSRHVITNNTIHNVGQIESGCRGIEVNGSVGVTISHNEIHDMPHIAIILGGNDHIIEFNEIYDVVKETSDSGAVYSGRDWAARGNIVRYNYFHDLVSIAGGQIQAVYLDDLASGFLIYGNIFHNVQRG